LFIADFVGDANVVTGELTGRDGERGVRLGWPSIFRTAASVSERSR